MKILLGTIAALSLLSAGFGAMLCLMGAESLVVGGTPAKLRWLGGAAMVVGAPLLLSLICMSYVFREPGDR